jgi:hypothetical protein
MRRLGDVLQNRNSLIDDTNGTEMSASVYKSNPPSRKTAFSAKYARHLMRACAQLRA